MENNHLANLSSFRKAKNLTQKEMADKLHVSRQTYCGYEAGKYEPNIGVLIEMSKILDVSIDALVGNTLLVDSLKEKESLISEINEVISRYKL